MTFDSLCQCWSHEKPSPMCSLHWVEPVPAADESCQSCDDGQCVTGPQCVALDNPPQAERVAE